MALSQHLKSVAKSISKTGLIGRAGKTASAIYISVIALLYSTAAHAEYGLNFQDPVTQTARDIYWLHMLIFWICVAIFVAVFGVMFYSIFKHRRSKNYEPAQFSHSTNVEIVWTVIPFLILVVMAIPATQVLIKMEDTTKSDLTIKITGYQWKWGYEYLGTDVEFYSTLTTPREQIDQFDKANAQPLGENYLLEVDNYLVVPSGRKVRALITANDVIHAWWIPAFGTKKDAIPGYINELWFNVDEGKEGLYRGQCAELCGKDHAFMPIVVKVVSGAEFDSWLAAGGSFDHAPIASSEAEPKTIEELSAQTVEELSTSESVVQAIVPAANAAEDAAKEWGKDELMVLGEEVSARCVACHGVEGKGLTGVFPAIARSAVATGPIEAHIDIVMFGKAGTAMAAFAGQLNDEELAAVVTYQRNSFGNNVGDIVLPADIQAKRK